MTVSLFVCLSLELSAYEREKVIATQRTAHFNKGTVFCYTFDGTVSDLPPMPLRDSSLKVRWVVWGGELARVPVPADGMRRACGFPRFLLPRTCASRAPTPATCIIMLAGDENCSTLLRIF